MQGLNSKYLPALDHLRAIAALLVLQLHASQRFYWPLIHPGESWDGHAFTIQSPNIFTALFVEGVTGVSLFMVLSGFVFTFTCFTHQISYLRFLLNRVLRIYPLALSIVLVSSIADGSFNLIKFIRTALFPFSIGGPIFLGPFLGGEHWTAMFWTLSPEFQFYLIFPFLLIAVHRWGYTPIIMVMAATVSIRAILLIAGYPPQSVAYYSIFGRLDQFMVGMLVGILFRTHSNTLRFRWLAPCGLACISIVLQIENYLQLTNPSGHLWRIFFPSLEAIAWGIFIFGYISIANNWRGWFSKALAWIGTISFSIYLLHYALIYFVLDSNWLLRLSNNPYIDTGINVIAFGGTMMLIATASYCLIEKPFLSFRVRYLKNNANVRKLRPDIRSTVAQSLHNAET